ncbi:retention module-containing protein, partial [Shewanella sp. 10N.261.52.F9]|uniref:retention module-containing protein n=1 Tax=Shewanella sp. 10N.261.52.F9 TaxID=3229684 RepID=UPI0035523DF2
MDKFIPKQDAKILELSGAINTSTAQGNNTPLKVGDTLRENVVYSASVGTTFLLQYSDGTTVTQDEVANLSETEAPQDLATIDPSVDAEIAALQAKVLSGEDPTLNLPDTAAGESAPTGNEGSGFIAVGRTGDETIAAAGHDTEGFTQVELPRVEEEQNFLSQLNPPSIISRSVTLYEQHLEQGTSPQSALLSQAESVSVIVQAGIQSLTINGLQVFADGNFVGPVTIITQFGTLTISSYDISTSTLSYSYTLSSNFDHSATDTLSEIFVLELTDSQGASVTSVVTANVIDDAPNGLDDSNQIAEGDIDGVNGNVLQNDTLGADSGSLTQITNSDNIGVDVTGSTVISGVYGTLTIAADGSYTYQLNNQLPEIQALAIGEQLIEFFDYQLSDSDGDSIVQTLTITITGENDAPEVTSSLEDAMGTVIEAGVLVGGNTETAGIPQVSGTLTANDIDNGAVLTWQLTSDPITPYGVFSIDQVTGEWTFSLDNELANSLAFGETTTEIFTITVTDQFGLFDTQEITITIVGTNDIPELTVTNSGSVTEDSIDLQPDRLVATGDITTFDVDNNDVLTLSA